MERNMAKVYIGLDDAQVLYWHEPLGNQRFIEIPQEKIDGWQKIWDAFDEMQAEGDKYYESFIGRESCETT
tara:strand:- start:2756 stop:2968 length:213 start_codon:yes stop_codon:yes gene_type:complete